MYETGAQGIVVAAMLERLGGKTFSKASVPTDPSLFDPLDPGGSMG